MHPGTFQNWNNKYKLPAATVFGVEPPRYRVHGRWYKQGKISRLATATCVKKQRVKKLSRPILWRPCGNLAWTAGQQQKHNLILENKKCCHAALSYQ